MPPVISWQEVATASSPDGRELVLYERQGQWTLRVDGWELMSSRAHRSEEALAEIACAAIAGRPGPRALAPRVLVGGLGMGFTLAAALRALPEDATVLAAELVPEVVEWNRGALGAAAGRPLDDPRARVHIGDVAEPLADPECWDAVLLDVDNGPSALVDARNDRLYAAGGLAELRVALRPAGVLATWGADDDAGYAARLAEAGFTVERRTVPARGRPGDPDHTLWLARRTSAS